jgi:beta-glucosidase
VSLAAGASELVRIALEPSAFSCWDENQHRRYVPSGTYRIAVGGSSRDLPLEASLDVQGSPP